MDGLRPGENEPKSSEDLGNKLPGSSDLLLPITSREIAPFSVDEVTGSLTPSNNAPNSDKPATDERLSGFFLARHFTSRGSTMSLCRRCALNGVEVEGGGLGVCSQHAKTKCRYYGCEARTLGEELCATHAHVVEIARWTAKAELRVIDPGADTASAELRHEKLMHAKFLAHEAVEVFFRSLIEASAGVFGDRPADEKKKAA
jgi:hypothetical protein